MDYLDKQRFDYEDSQRYDEPDNTIIYLVVTDDTEVVFSSEHKTEAFWDYDREVTYPEYNKIALREMPYTDFKNGKDKHNIENSTLIEFKEL